METIEHLIKNDPFSDTITYYPLIEPLYKILVSFIRIFTSDPKIALCIIDILALVGPFVFILKNSNNKLLSIIIFVLIGSFSSHFFILRQVLALPIILLSYCFAEKRRFWPFLAMVIVAIIILIPNIIEKIENKKYKIFSYIAIAALLSAFIIKVPVFSNYESDIITITNTKEEE